MGRQNTAQSYTFPVCLVLDQLIHFKCTIIIINITLNSIGESGIQILENGKMGEESM